MTVIAARYEFDHGKIEMVADTQVTVGFSRIDRYYSKIVALDEDFVIGMAGSAEEASLMKVFASTQRPRFADESGITAWLKDFNDFLKEHTDERTENSYILLIGGRGFVSHGFYVTPMETFAAIGSGAPYALSAMHYGASATEAVETAIEFDVGCSGPIMQVAVPTPLTGLEDA